MSRSAPLPTTSAPVLWITGLSGVGKSTLAKGLVAELRDEGSPVVLIDGDEFREAMGGGLGHSQSDRLANAMRICRFVKLIADQGVPVVVATMSLFREVHEWTRANLSLLSVVYLHAPMPFLAARDPRGLYADALANRRADVVGVHLPFDPPRDPDLSLDVSALANVHEGVGHIRAALNKVMPMTVP